MALLPEEQRTAIILKEYHGLTFQEIADLLDCPLSTVKTRLYQGLTVLRKQLEVAGVESVYLDQRRGRIRECVTTSGLLDYLYDELSAAERKAFEIHVHDCSACRSELPHWAARVTPWPCGRRRIPSWASGSSAKKRLRRRRRAFWTISPHGDSRRRPFCFSRSARQSRTSRSSYGSEGFMVRTGLGRSTAPRARRRESTCRLSPSPASSDEWKRAACGFSTLGCGSSSKVIARLPRRRPSGRTRLPRMSDAEILREVRKIIAESETRQQRELALRVTQVVSDVDAARVGDLARVERGLRQIQGLTDAEMIRHRDTLNHLLRVTQQR